MSPPKGSGPKSGATNPQAPAAVSSDRFSQLEKLVAEIRDGTIRNVLEKLRRLSYKIEEINIRFLIHSRVPPVLSTCPLQTNSACGKER